MRAFTILFAVLAVAACGGKSAPAGGGGGGGAGGGGGEAPYTGPMELAPGQWDTMDHEAQANFMGHVVLPTMAAEFKAFDAEEFGHFDCATCHGDGAHNHTFEMPNPGLPELSMDEIMNPDDDHKAITEFMMTKVKPGMAKMLGEPEYSQENPEGFGCFHCHTMKK